MSFAKSILADSKYTLKIKHDNVKSKFCIYVWEILKSSVQGQQIKAVQNLELHLWIQCVLERGIEHNNTECLKLQNSYVLAEYHLLICLVNCN